MVVSCATLFKKQTTTIDIHTTKPTKIVVLKDTVETVNNNVRIKVLKSRAPVYLRSITDSCSTLIQIRSPYPKAIILKPEKQGKKYSKFWNYDRTGELYLNFSFPHFNFYNFAPENESPQTLDAFMGISIGADYFYCKNQFVNLTWSSVIDFPFPFPIGPLDFFGDYYSMRSKYISLSNNHKINRFSFGYGLSYGRNSWYHEYGSVMTNENGIIQFSPTIKRYDVLGLVFSSYIELGRQFSCGVIYRPTFLRPNSINAFRYEHLISVDFAWKIRLKR